MNVGDNSYYLKSKNYTTDGTTGMYINLNDGSITANTGTFKGDIIINYTGSTGDGWAYGNKSLSYILNQIGKAAKEAGDLAESSIQWTKDLAQAQDDIKYALNGISSTVSMLDKFFEIGTSIDAEGYVHYGQRPSFTSPLGGSVAVGSGVQITGDRIIIGDNRSSVNFQSATIYITGSTTLEEYIRQIAGV